MTTPNTSRRPELPPPSDPDAAAADRLIEQMLQRALGGATAPGARDLSARILDAIDQADEDPTDHDQETEPRPEESRAMSRTPDSKSKLTRTPFRDRRRATRPDQAPIWWIISATAAALLVVGTIALAMWSHDSSSDLPDGIDITPPPLAAGGPDDPVQAPPVKPWFTESHRMTDGAAGQMWFSADGQTVATVRGDGMLAVGPASSLVESGGASSFKPIMQWPKVESGHNGPRMPGQPAPVRPMQPHARFTEAGLLVSTGDGLILVDPSSGGRTPLASGANHVLSVSPSGFRMVVRNGQTVRLLKVEPVNGMAPTVDLDGTFVPGAWSSDSGEVFGVVTRPPNAGDPSGTLGQTVVRINAEDGATSSVIDGDQISPMCGKDIDISSIRVIAVTGSGASAKLQLTAQQRSFWDDPRNQGRRGTHTYGAAPRGRNPGSAEPGPDAPSWEFLVTDGKATLLHKRHLARYIDQLLVLPAADLSRFSFLQLAQLGGAGDADDPQIWVGTIDAAGKKQESKLAANPFPAEWHNLSLSVLDRTDDGKLLMLVKADVTLDRPWMDGAQGMMQAMQAGFTITRMWSDDNGSHVGTPVFGLFQAIV